MCNDIKKFVTYSESINKCVTIANNNKLKIRGTGNVKIRVKSEGKIIPFIIHDVNYTPELCTNLLSVRKLVKSGYEIMFKNNICYLKYKSEPFFEMAKIKDDMYRINIEDNSEKVCLAREVDLSFNWHRKLGHPGFQSMSFLKDILPNFQIPKGKCEICIKAKHSKRPFKSSGRHSDKPLQLVHMDVCGPLPEKSLGGHLYFVTFIDDYSKKIFLYTLQGKYEVFEKFREFKAQTENQTGEQLKP